MIGIAYVSTSLLSALVALLLVEGQSLRQTVSVRVSSESSRD